MKRFFAFVLLGVSAFANAETPPTVAFRWFEYQGQDAIYAKAPPARSFHNPILAGYYPDPSVVRVGDTFYLVNSTFAHWPGIPIHSSRDLVHWKLIGHALSDPAKVTFDGLSTSRGVFAPSIHFHDGTFYIINTLVDAGGNYFVTAKDPAGPWSDPVWLKEIDGIDPSFFFDDDGKAFVLNNGPPEGTPLYQGHRAIWMQEFDLAANKLTGPRKVIVNGGADISKKPIWIEGPHLYRIKGWYYLMCAEGGTGSDHSEVVFRSKSPWGAFEPYKNNPILTQRDLSPDRANPVTNAGHADLVQMKDGSWWSVFLASRPYEGFRFNTGRETFLLPVTWKNGWPVILAHGKAIPTTLKAPLTNTGLADSGYDALSGNFTQREEFDGALGPEWLQVRVPKENWFAVSNGALQIHALKGKLLDKQNTSFLARRQQHAKFEASTELAMPPAGVAAGLAVFQNEDYWYTFGVLQLASGPMVIFERCAPDGGESVAKVLPAVSQSVRLKITANGGKYSFYYDAGQGWKAMRENDDGSILSTEVAGGFVGTVLGPFARQE
ncbi:MAG TPA: glycoside hydrolase family 43 protein [Steroidobacteraceae bacterium]|jgi:alpha-N-arabinofuranosidase|nr:glycoside hydrolase family 43 protein [Steroidobacteraceae bacterium]